MKAVEAKNLHVIPIMRLTWGEGVSWPDAMGIGPERIDQNERELIAAVAAKDTVRSCVLAGAFLGSLQARFRLEKKGKLCVIAVDTGAEVTFYGTTEPLGSDFIFPPTLELM